MLFSFSFKVTKNDLFAQKCTLKLYFHVTVIWEKKYWEKIGFLSALKLSNLHQNIKEMTHNFQAKNLKLLFAISAEGIVTNSSIVKAIKNRV